MAGAHNLGTGAGFAPWWGAFMSMWRMDVPPYRVWSAGVPAIVRQTIRARISHVSRARRPEWLCERAHGTLR
eukprot:5708986-Prymnesium_polylepis.1